MASPYTTQSISGYNQSPPADDASQVASNQVEWAKHKDKLADPIKTLVEAINTELVAAFGKIWLNGISAKTTNYTVVAGDQGKLISCTNTITVTLLPAATASTNFQLVVRNNGSGVVTIDGNASETINGETTQTLVAGEAVSLISDGSNWQSLRHPRDDIDQAVAPTGSVLGWTTGTAPSGWLHCNGAAVSRTTYADLFGVIGVIYGNGDGSTTFNLPDYRGEFLRGFDNGAGNDPDAASRTDRGDGTTGDNVGTKQATEVGPHNHGITDPGHNHGIQGSQEADLNPYGGAVPEPGTSRTTVSESVTTGITVDNSTGDESRPRNVGVMWIIKT